MKKAVIIVIVISVCVVGGFLLLQTLTDKGLEYAEDEKAKVMTKIEDTVLRLAVLDVTILVDDWYWAGNKTKFEDNSANLAEVGKTINKIKNEKNVRDLLIEYHIYSSATQNYVTKIKVTGSDDFYCIDTTQDLPIPELLSSKDMDFESSVACSGEILP